MNSYLWAVRRRKIIYCDVLKSQWVKFSFELNDLVFHWMLFFASWFLDVVVCSSWHFFTSPEQHAFVFSNFLTGNKHVSMQLSRTLSGLTNLLFNRRYAKINTQKNYHPSIPHFLFLLVRNTLSLVYWYAALLKWATLCCFFRFHGTCLYINTRELIF